MEGARFWVGRACFEGIGGGRVPKKSCKFGIAVGNPLPQSSARIMPPMFAHGLKACCVAVALVFATAHAAEQPQPASSMGWTRDQVLAKYGEPKSQIAAGNRVVMFYAKERLVLRDGVVIEVERLSSDPALRRIAPVEAAPVPAAPLPVAPSAVPVAVATTPTVAAPAVPATVSGPAEATVPVAPTAPISTAPPAPEPKLEIKLVRPPSANYSRPSAKPERATPPPPVTATPPSEPSRPPAVATGTTTPSARDVAASSPRGGSSSPSSSTPTARTTVTVVETVATTPTATEKPEPAVEEVANDDEAAKLAAAKEKKAKLNKVKRRLTEAGTEEEPDISEAFLTTQTFVISFLVIGGGIGYLIWRSRQRQLELAATAVSHTPFESTPGGGSTGGAAFTAELLSKLEWKRFEELVADYYTKTGVVAVRTKSGPTTPVHVKISWKGEPRPFACVQCIAHPTGLVDVKPLQDLFAVLTAEDIRRGYVVTAGKFNVNARDYAEEKHITLLPGDIFLEKLNALPDAARAEIMQTISTGDNQTPSCPKCDAKMVHSPDESGWKCASHADQIIPAWR